MPPPPTLYDPLRAARRVVGSLLIYWPAFVAALGEDRAHERLARAVERVRVLEGGA